MKFVGYKESRRVDFHDHSPEEIKQGIEDQVVFESFSISTTCYTKKDINSLIELLEDLKKTVKD